MSHRLALVLFGNSATVIQTHFRSPSLGGQGVLTRLREKKNGIAVGVLPAMPLLARATWPVRRSRVLSADPFLKGAR